MKLKIKTEHFGIPDDEYYSIVSGPSRSRFIHPCFTYFSPSLIARIGRLKKGKAEDSHCKVKVNYLALKHFITRAQLFFTRVM
ncbi:unnamed protein product [Eruca vesicaria subsp. sativa]|uniref:Uncharacterized protein n=1 Tax=Eruca vesicaria subsp. sativa TaxID=29727 RepID=A0ABC8KHS8_ERUVS|nr:unnamed protein product [Eruca vesicaria subsp. sativa]